MMQPPQQVGAPGEDKHVQNPAEVDHVPGDGQGALLPPMGQAERKAMEDRINNGGVAQQDAQLYKRGYDTMKLDLEFADLFRLCPSLLPPPPPPPRYRALAIT